MTLSRKQQVFVEEYLKCRNASEAARRAGYSERTAGSIGHENLKKPEIAEEIERRTQAKAMAVTEALGILADQARGTMEDFVSFNHAPYPTFTLDLDKARRRGVLHLIQEISYDRRGNPKIKLYDAKDAAKAILDFNMHGPKGTEDDPIHTINYIREVRPETPERSE